ncbi:hypothetical protein QFC20_001000 [Naganishia adeliensis]|uniref:Uncharacterized protein n=1 Tax=Naganishia adeliensis TaxID=92952 RepID=A0ACC2WV81_9TREE|nr:hypothetical protein QFC20_001000 [Naganishia adeliensis]
MTCVRQPHQALPPAGFNSSGFPITADKVQDDWRTIAKEETATEDIRFSFSIWHVPTSISEPGQRKSDTAIRGRTPSRLVRPSIPFAWLPLLPLDQSTESPQARGVVETGISLSLPLTDEEQQVSTPTLIRRIPTAIVEVDEDALLAKKKQRLSLGTKEMEQEETMASWEDAGRVVSAQKARNLSGPVIRKVRMRDVDIVEDFLDQFLPEFGTGVPLRILLGATGVAALAVQDGPSLDDAKEPPMQRPEPDALDPSLPILALVLYRKTCSDFELVTTHVQAIAVRPTSRRRGLGQQLVSEALKDSREAARRPTILGAPKIRLKAEGYDDNGSREFWQRCVAGLQVSSRRIGCRRGWVGEVQL